MLRYLSLIEDLALILLSLSQLCFISFLWRGLFTELLHLLCSPWLQLVQCDISNKPIANQHEGHDTHIYPHVVQPHRFDRWKIHNPAHDSGRAPVYITLTELNSKEELVAVEAVAEVLEPHDEWGNLLHVITSSNEEDEGSDRCKCSGLFHIHKYGTNGKAEALGDEDIVQNHEEGEKEVHWVRLEATHPVDDDDKGSGKGKLHGEVTNSAGEEVRGEAVHP